MPCYLSVALRLFCFCFRIFAAVKSIAYTDHRSFHVSPVLTYNFVLQIAHKHIFRLFLVIRFYARNVRVK